MLFSLQLHINTTEHKGPGYYHIYYTTVTLQDKGNNYVFTTSRLDNTDFNIAGLFLWNLFKIKDL